MDSPSGKGEECPFSGAAFGAVKYLQARMGDQMRYVFRPFPLDDIHPHALHAALAGEAATAQGEFWAMHDLMFNHQDKLSDANLMRLAQRAGLDAEKFQSAFGDKTLGEIVHRSVQSGRDLGVHGTPTFFINGQMHDNREGLWDVATLQEAIEQAHKPLGHAGQSRRKS